MINQILRMGISVLITLNSNSAPDTRILFNGATLDGWQVFASDDNECIFVADSSIILKMGSDITGIKWIKDFPITNYEVSLEAKRIEGKDFFCGLTFPVKKSFCTLIVGGWGGSVVGLSCIDDQDAANNITTAIRDFLSDHWYTIRVKVTNEKIEAWIDHDNIVDFTIGDHILSLRTEVETCKPFGIATWQTTGAFRNIKLDMISE